MKSPHEHQNPADIYHSTDRFEDINAEAGYQGYVQAGVFLKDASAITHGEVSGSGVEKDSVESAERNHEPKFTTRRAQLTDLDALVELDIEAFKAVYAEYDQTDEELREELGEKFAKRLEKIDLDWVRVAEMDGEICGFMMSCPTSKAPEDFVSWEDTTNHGTLEGTYDPNGENVYVVSLTMPRPECGDSPKNMLFVDQIGKMIQDGYKRGYFESRMPGLREWVTEECQKRSLDLGKLEQEELTALANEYASSKVIRNGKEVLRDPHLRMYESIGCRFEAVVPDAYQDGPSMNYGVVAVYENPLPASIQRSARMSRMAGGVIRLAGRSHAVTKRLF